MRVGLCLIFVLCWFTMAQEEFPALDVFAAQRARQVVVSYHPSGFSPNYVPFFTLTNETDSVVVLKLPQAAMLFPNDESQRLATGFGRQNHLRLQPKQRMDIPTRYLCLSKKRCTPHSDTRYSWSELSPDGLQGLLRELYVMVYSRQIRLGEAQNIVWHLNEEQDLDGSQKQILDQVRRNVELRRIRLQETQVSVVARAQLRDIDVVPKIGITDSMSDLDKRRATAPWRLPALPDSFSKDVAPKDKDESQPKRVPVLLRGRADL